jgi:uncharacterized protein (TIGR02996 family)
MRTFKFADDKSYKFWNIELEGKSFTVTFGRIGTKGQSQTKEFPSAEKASAAHEKLISEKLGKGYVETTPAAPAATTENVLERALHDDPDDIAAHSAYADWLIQQGDPRGEFMQVQLLLEDESRPAEERAELKKREKALLDKHGRTWLGPLADSLLAASEGPVDARFQYQFARGWLEYVHVPHLSVNFARLLAAAPEARLLRRLVIFSTDYEDEFEPGPDVPTNTEYPHLYPLRGASFLANLRTFQLGETYEDSRWGGPGCHTNGEVAVDLVAKMPRIEELYLLAHHVDSNKLFALKNLQSLRILQVDHSYDYPLDVLAKNAALKSLTHLMLHPHGLDHDDPYIRIEHLRALVESKHLTSLRYLRLCCSDLGDEGCGLLRGSDLLGRLTALELSHGCISDAGARDLVDAPDLSKLELLDLSFNALSPESIEALQKDLKRKHPKLVFRAAEQHSADELENRMYLFEADPE